MSDKSLAGVAEQAQQRLEGGAARLSTPVGKALAVLDQVEAEGPLAVQILVVFFS